MCTASSDVDLKELLLQKFSSLSEAALKLGCSEKSLRNVARGEAGRRSIFVDISDELVIPMETLVGSAAAGSEMSTYEVPKISRAELLKPLIPDFELSFNFTDYGTATDAEISYIKDAEYKAQRCDSTQCSKHCFYEAHTWHRHYRRDLPIKPLFHICEDIKITEAEKEALTNAYDCIEAFTVTPRFSSDFDFLISARSAYSNFDNARSRLNELKIDIFFAVLKTDFIADFDSVLPYEEKKTVKGELTQALFIFCPLTIQEVIGTYGRTEITGGSDEEFVVPF
jgi:hypothetical protein